MIQWTGNNLKEVIDFTGKSQRFEEWFKSWEEFETYVHQHNDILKLFCEDGSHYEVPIGAWIAKTPDGYNVSSVAKYIPKDMGEVSDGYHTFNELYYYRMLYNAAFFNILPKGWVHKSKRHHTGEECFGGGWFIVMANLPTGQVSNHYELKDWDLFKVPEKEFADEWDGHTPQEAADRLYEYLKQEQPHFAGIGKMEQPESGGSEKPNYQQPEVDLEKFTEKIKTFQGRYKHPENISVKGAMAFMARMFYQYPNTARQWYDSLPKATMDDARKEK